MEQYSEYLYRIAYYYVKDTYKAEDIVQDVFLKFYHAEYDEQGQLKAYLARMTANACKDYFKSWSYRKLKLTATFLSTERVTDRDRLIEQEELRALDLAILKLPVKKREAICYYYLENMSIKEIAEILQIAESTVKSRLQSARKELKALLNEQQWEVLSHE